MSQQPNIQSTTRPVSPFSLMVMAVLLLLAGCSTQKANWSNVTYHNITCHYNVWWNGNESYKEGLRKLEKTFKDDYTQILPVYQIGSKEQSMGIYQQMDKAIEKGIKGIKKHSIYLQGREYVKYVKNCYLLTAYATFEKQDYAATANTCRLIITQYSGSPESDEAKILLARCQTQEKQFSDAEVVLDQLVNDQQNGNFSAKLNDKLYLAMIEAVLPQEKYKKAVQYIRLALDETSNHHTKARLYFIMAQIYQTLDKRPTATKYFEKVLKCRPDYVMEFNARINIASCATEEHTNLSSVEKDLDKMLKDKKNQEFHDQIYYAKGDMYMGMKDAKKACDNYRMSVAVANGNPMQKAKSALRMADILYEYYENYDEAQKYYDTAMHIIKAGYPHFDEIRSRYNTLTALVENTRLIHLNDSLLTWADMDPGKRSQLIQQKIEQLRQQEKEEEERKLLEELKQETQSQQNTLEGDWYFYNHNTVSKGKQTFRQRWGVRTLNDYWFISKSNNMGLGSMIPGMEESNDDLDDDSDSTVAVSVPTENNNPEDPHCQAFYLKDLPTTQGQRDTMHADIARCLLNAGYIYYDGIENTDRALECYLRLAKDYPDADEIVQAFYQLWRIYSKQGNTPQANYYRDMVLMGFPDCDYANMIRDDQYYLEIIRRTEVAQNEYSTVYNLYRRKKYRDVVSHVDAALQAYNEQPLMGKFRYWKGLAAAQLGDTAMATVTFQTIVADYDDTSRLVELAKEQLAYLRTGRYSTMGGGEEVSSDDEAKGRSRYKENVQDVASSNKTSESNSKTDENALPQESLMYRYREQLQHYVAVLINDKKIVATQLQYAIADFNMQNYSNSGYRASPLLFTDTVQMLTIHRFQNAAEAELYRTHLLLDGGPLSKYDPKDYVVFSISTQNYNTFYNQKNIEAYQKFYEYYYHNGERRTEN